MIGRTSWSHICDDISHLNSWVDPYGYMTHLHTHLSNYQVHRWRQLSNVFIIKSFGFVVCNGRSREQHCSCYMLMDQGKNIKDMSFLDLLQVGFIMKQVTYGLFTNGFLQTNIFLNIRYYMHMGSKDT